MNVQKLIEPQPSTRYKIARRETLARTVLEKIRTHNITEPRHGPTFTIAQASALVGRSSSAIRMAEAEGRLPSQPRIKETGRRENYTLEQLNHMREVFRTRPWRAPTDSPVILPVHNFKGGVGKSTISVHLSQYLAMHGYRVLLIDADAQASSTMMFGYIPDSDLRGDDTIYACLNKGQTLYRPLAELIRPTHYDGLHLVPANLHLYNSEYEIAARMASGGEAVLTMLRNEIETIADNYDVIILDPPPELGMVSLSVLYSANSLLIPMPPNIIDFASTTSFFSMLSDTMDFLDESGLSVDYGFIQIIISRSDETKMAYREIVTMANSVFGRTVMDTEIKNSAEIDNCTAKQQSVYDVTAATTNHQVRRRCLNQMNELNGEIEKQIRSLWPSTQDAAI